jgi:hypothetical protein
MPNEVKIVSHCCSLARIVVMGVAVSAFCTTTFGTGTKPHLSSRINAKVAGNCLMPSKGSATLTTSQRLEQPRRTGQCPLKPLGTRDAPLAPASCTSPTPSLNFLGSSLGELASPVFPPDAAGAVGPSQFVAAVNGRLVVRSKANPSQVDYDVTLDDFFSITLCDQSPCWHVKGPHVRYDRLTGQWFIEAWIYDDLPNTSVVIAYSDVPSGGIISGSTSWTFVSFGFFPGPAQPAPVFPPTFSVDSTSLVIGLDFIDPVTGYIEDSDAYVMPKAAAYVYYFSGLDTLGDAGGGEVFGTYTPWGVDADTGTTGEIGIIVGQDSWDFGILDYYKVAYATDPGPPSHLVPSLSGPYRISVPPTSYIQPTVGIGTLGASTGINSVDDRLYGASLRNATVWTSHHIAVDHTGDATFCQGSPDNPECRAAIRWYALNRDITGDLTLLTSGTVFDTATSDPRNYWQPAVAVNGPGQAAVGFSTAGTSHYIDAGYVYSAGSPSAGMCDPVLYAISSTVYDPSGDGSGGGSLHPWGYSSQTSLDPCDDLTMWTIQEFCDGTDSYGVQVAKIPWPPPTLPVSVTPSIIFGGQTNISLSVTGSGFYDPGSITRLGCPNLHLSASLNAGPSVNTTTFVDTTHLTLNVDSNTTGGNFDLTITNPDGQAVTASQAVEVRTTVPPEVATTGLNWTGKTALSWLPNDYATSYNVYRGTKGQLPALLPGTPNSCLKYSGASATATIVDDPGSESGRFYWYLITGSNPVGEGPSGSGTGGTRTLNSTGVCP